MKKTYLFFLIIIVLSNFIYATPPFIAETGNGINLQIEYPKLYIYPNNTTITLNFHIYNSSNYILDNISTSCLIHVYNNTGANIIQDKLNFDSNKIDFFYTLNGSFISKNAYYSYVIACNNSREAGYLSTNFIVTANGQDINPQTSSENLIYVLLIIPIALIFFFVYWASTLPEDQEPLKWFMRLLSLVCIFLLYGAATIAISLNPAYNAFLMLYDFSVYGMIFFGVLAIFILYIIYRIFMAFKLKKNDDFKNGVFK